MPTDFTLQTAFQYFKIIFFNLEYKDNIKKLTRPFPFLVMKFINQGKPGPTVEITTSEYDSTAPISSVENSPSKSSGSLRFGGFDRCNSEKIRSELPFSSNTNLLSPMRQPPRNLLQVIRFHQIQIQIQA